MKKKKERPSDEIKGKVTEFYQNRDCGLYEIAEIRWQKLMEWLDEELG